LRCIWLIQHCLVLPRCQVIFCITHDDVINRSSFFSKIVFSQLVHITNLVNLGHDRMGVAIWAIGVKYTPVVSNIFSSSNPISTRNFGPIFVFITSNDVFLCVIVCGFTETFPNPVSESHFPPKTPNILKYVIVCNRRAKMDELTEPIDLRS
jgi:hypothetical protein